MLGIILFFSVPFIMLVAMPAFALVAKVKKENSKAYKPWQLLSALCLVLLIVWIGVFVTVGFF
nr:hypothetical protein [uncultured Cellulosilyticum sp.]